MVNNNTILEFKHITKTYPGVTALQDVSFEVFEGEVHAIVGENGAGKSTLIKTCTGAETPDSGEVSIRGESFAVLTPKLSKQKGVAVIYQEFNLVDELSVAENIFLGRAIRKGVVINKKAMEMEALELFNQFDIAINPKALVSTLTVGYRQLVEIAKAISQHADILIMDEPSAPLTTAEAERLYSMVKKMQASGVTIIYISHRMDEIFELSDRVTIMRDGHKIQTMQTEETNLNEVVSLMVGRELTETYPSRDISVSQDVVLDVQNLSGNGLHNITFSIQRGEVVGLAGLIGAGRTELAELIFGVKKKTNGSIQLQGKILEIKNPQDAIGHGIAFVPEDRKKQGLILQTSVTGNISLAILKSISSVAVVHTQEEKRIGSYYQKALAIKTPTLRQQAKNLSGGNQQKVVLAKWLATEPELIILDEPTRGIDVGAKYEIYTLINSLVAQGKTILMISSEMEELMGMSDRIIVLSEGRVTGELQRSEFDQELIMSFASKITKEGVV